MIEVYDAPKLTLERNEVFVFGSNLQGFHGAGAAGYATSNDLDFDWRDNNYAKLPAGTRGKWNIKGQATGLMIGTEGRSYAIPTVTRAGAKRSIKLLDIKVSVDEFYKFARLRPHIRFYVAQEAKTGMNGYSPREMASVYSGEIPDNVYFDRHFAALLRKSEKGFRCIIAGSRTITDYDLVVEAVKDSGFTITEVVSGAAKGVDKLGERWAREKGLPVASFPAPWDEINGKPENEIGKTDSGRLYWKRAGAYRNQTMANYADGLIAITTGSSGTADMIERAKVMKLQILIKEGFR